MTTAVATEGQDNRPGPPLKVKALANGMEDIMGMDVFGRNPLNEEGRYFRASIWEWPSIYNAMVKLCQDLVDDETLTAMGYNEGAGPVAPAACQEMARRFDDWLEGPDFEDRSTISTMGVHTVESDSAQGLKVEGCEVLARRQVRELLSGWVGFLRHCGGFEVW